MMRKTRLPKFLISPFYRLLGLVSGGMPVSSESGEAKRPYDRSREITQKACIKAAAVSGGLALPVGPLAMLTVLPDLLIVWRIQAQMVADIAVAFGHKQPLTEQELATCLFKHVAGNAVREYERSIPLEHEQKLSASLLDLFERFTGSGSRDVAVRVSKQLAQIIIQRVAKRTASRIIPLAGAVVVSAYAALDTREVARTAVELFSGDKLPARKNQTKYPRSDDLFNAKNLKDIQPD